MNETTWIISPNWVAWTLLGVTTASLLVIAIRMCLWKSPKRPTSQYDSNKIRDKHSNLSWYALVLSTISIGCALFAPNSNGDASVIVAALGVLVTLLVTWQILNTIEANKIIKRAEDAETRFNSKTETLQKQINQLRLENEASMFFDLAQHTINKVEVSKRNLTTCLSISTAYECYLNALIRFLDAESTTRYLNMCLGQMSICLQLLGDLKFSRRPYDNCETSYLKINRNSKSFEESVKNELERLHNERREMGVNEDSDRLVKWMDSNVNIPEPPTTPSR